MIQSPESLYSWRKIEKRHWKFVLKFIFNNNHKSQMNEIFLKILFLH